MADSQTKQAEPDESTESAAPTTPRLRRWLLRLVFLAAIPGVLALSYLWYAQQQVAKYRQLSQAALEAEQWEQLQRDALSWYQWQPELAKPLLYAAAAAEELGQWDNVSIYLSQLPDDDPESVPGLLRLSDIEFVRLNRPFDAAITWRQILQIQPDHREAHRRLSYFYAMSRQRTEMIRESRRAIDVGSDLPTTYLYLFGADWMPFTNGAQVNDRWLTNTPNNEILLVARAFHYTRSMAFSEQGQKRDEQGVNVLERIMIDLLEEFPKNIELLAYHLELSTYRGDREKTLLLLEQAPPESAEDSRFWRFKGWVHQDRQQWEEAVRAYTKCLEMHPYDGQAQQKLAAVYRRLRKPEKVAKHTQLASLAQDILRMAHSMPDLESMPPELLEKMAEYAALCGVAKVAAQLEKRLAEPAVTTEPAPSDRNFSPSLPDQPLGPLPPGEEGEASRLDQTTQ